METSSWDADTQLSQDNRLMGPDIDIVQDVEQDLEDYSRLAKLGRFGEASAFFGEILSRNLNCFAVLAEHCYTLADQGDFTNVELTLADSLNRQSHTQASDCFERDENQLLRLLLAYTRMFNGHDQRQEGEAVIQARWSLTLVNVSNSSELTDVQVRKTNLLMC